MKEKEIKVLDEKYREVQFPLKRAGIIFLR
jgi:hypothetical protein